MSIITFNPITYGTLSFTNITVTETDSGTAADIVDYTSSPGVLSAILLSAGAELSWGAANAGVYYGPSLSEVVNFAYTVTDTSDTTLLDAFSQSWTTDAFSGPGVSLSAVENVYSTGGALVGAQTFALGATNAPAVQFTAAEQSVNVSVTLTMATSAAGTLASEVLISAFQQSFATIPDAQNPASIGDIVFFDAAGTGLETGFDAGPGISGVTVELLDGTGTNVLATTTTDTNGLYSFTGIAAGVYEVEFVAPTGFSFTTQGVGGTADAGINSSANQVTGITAPITLTAGQADDDVEAGLVAGGSAAGSTGTIGNIVWLDSNGDGLSDNGESGMAGVTVDLMDSTDTVVLATTMTNAAGGYQFTGLSAGTYEVQFFAPAGDTFTTANVPLTGGATVNSVAGSNGLTAPVTLAAGQVDDNVNAGLLLPSASIGSTVFLDANNDGLLDNGETGVAGVTVELLSAAGASVLATTTTNGSGIYAFTGLSAGTYEVQFIAPAGDAFTTEYVPLTGGATVNSAAGSNGLTAPVTLTSGQVDNNVNAGLTLASLGSTVFLDANRDGLLDNGETGVGGVTVELLNAAGKSVLATTTTNSSGTYAFTGLTAGAYEVEFVAPSGDIFTTQGVGTNPAINSSPNATTGITAPVTLTAGQVDNNVNAGLVTYNGISVLKLPSSVAANQGSTETYTFTVTNTGTTALTNVAVKDNVGTASSPVYVIPTLVTSGTNGTLAPGATWTYSATVSNLTGNSGSGATSGLTASTVLTDFNAVIFTNASTPSDIQGAAVIGGSFSGATVYTNPAASLPTGFAALTVFGSTHGNLININNGGNAYVGGTKGAGINFNGGGKYLTTAPATPISSLKSTFISLSSALAQLTATGTLPATGNSEVIKATPGSNGIAVINMTASQLAAIPSFSINLNGASTLVMNVSGSSASVNANDLNATTGDGNIIWNFYNETGTVALNTQIGGTVLAPGATVTNANQIDGALVANAWTGQGELHYVPFTGTLPSTVGTNVSSADDTVSVSAAAASGTTVTASDSKDVQVLGAGSDISVGGTPTTASLSATYGGAKTLEFTYAPGNTVSLKQVQAGLATVTGTNSDTMAFMAITNNPNPFASGASIYFEGEVTSGESIYADATTNVLTNTAIAGGHFSTSSGAAIFAYVFASQQAFMSGTSPLQTMAYNTSGSQAMHIGDVIGSLQVIGYVGASGGHLV